MRVCRPAMRDSHDVLCRRDHERSRNGRPHSVRRSPRSTDSLQGPRGSLHAVPAVCLLFLICQRLRHSQWLKSSLVGVRRSDRAANHCGWVPPTGGQDSMQPGGRSRNDQWKYAPRRGHCRRRHGMCRRRWSPGALGPAVPAAPHRDDVCRRSAQLDERTRHTDAQSQLEPDRPDPRQRSRVRAGGIVVACSLRVDLSAPDRSPVARALRRAPRSWRRG